MEIHYRLAEQDYASAAWASFKHYPLYSLWAYKYAIAVALAAVLVAAQAPDRWEEAGIILVIAAAVFAYISLAFRWSWRQQFRKASLGNRLLSAIIDGESIRLRGENREITKRWNEISDIYENRRLIVLRVANKRSLIFPKETMSQLQIQELRKLISSNAKCKVRLAA